MRMKDVKDTFDTWLEHNPDDTRMKACLRTVQYVHGMYKPHYPVPAIPGMGINGIEANPGYHPRQWLYLCIVHNPELIPNWKD